MTMPREYTTVGMLWVSVVSMATGILLAVIAAAVFGGRLDARVVSLEKGLSQTVQRGEWSQFEREVRERLERIERKLDVGRR